MKRNPPSTKNSPRELAEATRRGWTQIPNCFIDKVMPLVTPEYFKVLIFIWRKTVGWRKDRDAISNSQIQKGAGVCRDTAISAVRFWETVGLIQRLGRNGLRGTCEYAVNNSFDEEEVAGRLCRLVDRNDRSLGATATSRSHIPSVVDGVDTQKKNSHKTHERNASTTLSRSRSRGRDKTHGERKYAGLSI